MPSSPHPKDALVLQALSPDTPLPPKVQAHLASCPSCTAAQASLRAAADELLQGEAPVSPPEGVLAALRAEMTGPRRLERFANQVASLLDIEPAAARAFLGAVDSAEDWLTTSGISVRPVPSGPRLAQAVATLCRFEPGAGVEDHGHDAAEETLVLEGGFRDSLGREVWPGESLAMTPGTHHALTALPGVPCLCLIVAHLP